jgi:hypothetical protein
VISAPTVGRLVLAPLLLAALLAGCGGGPQAARPQIAAMLRTGLTTNDPVVLCERTLSAGLVARVYGGTERCLAVERGAAASRRQAGSVDVSRITVDGDRGSASVVVRGGDQDGARGPLTVVRQDGGWRLDDLSTAFLRSEFSAGATSNPDLDGTLARCLGRRIGALDDAPLRRLAFAAMGGRPQAQDQLQALVGACVEALSVPSAGGAA